MASADIPEEQWATAFRPEVVQERMKWVMEYDLLGELATQISVANDAANSESQSQNTGQQVASVL
jgi:salicylate hydroxylase